jgi:hypothetical protein
MHKARLHPHWTAAGYRYSVIFDGKLLIENSRDPECDAARALLKRGYTGQLHMLDGKTGIPRTIIDIEKAALLATKEGPSGPRFHRFRPVPEAPAAVEEASPAVDTSEPTEEAA